MALLDWVIIVSIALLAGAVIGVRRRGGRYFTKLDLRAWKTGSPNRYDEPELAIAAHNVRAQRCSEEEVITDGLTGLKTHPYFRETLDGEWRRSTHTGRQFCLTMMDLDRFKQVNDRMGRLEGDKVLTAVAALLDAQSRQPNVVARYGEDEFAILMPETNTQQAEILAESLRAAVEADDFLRAHEVTASFGIATFPDHGRTQEEVLRAADSGLHLAKHCSGNCVKVASLGPKAGNAERNERLLEAYLEAAVKGTFSAAPDTFSHYQDKFKQMKPLWDTIAALAFAVEAKGPYMKGHSQAVSRLAAQIAIQAGLSQAEVEEIRLAGLVHDIGKLHVPESALRKPTLLTAEEFEIMKSHAAWGENMLEPLKVKAIERIVRHHHERYDGKGYPDGLAGDTIPLGARIVAVAECFHSMVSDLPYRSARTFEDALAELRRCSDTQFDPQVVTAFLDWLQMYSWANDPIMSISS
jgi:diguanylate cyclase (GGDEF)-like protein/putative nucleotidyltransferase with HDIG domain